MGRGQRGACGALRSAWKQIPTEGENNYILYRPRSSSERPSSHLRSSSLVDFSEMALEILELFRTSSSTKMGQSTRKASARASLGRESMDMISPLRSTQISA